MAYTPINWQTGDTITAEKMNKMDNGWSVQKTQLFSETVTTVDDYGRNIAQFTYAQQITAKAVTVTFAGVDYTIPCGENDFGAYYGEVDSYGDPVFTTYPFYIFTASDGYNSLETETAGTYTVTVTAHNYQLSADFNSAVNSAVTIPDISTVPFRCESGVTTVGEIAVAFDNGRIVCFYYSALGQPGKIFFVTSFRMNFGSAPTFTFIPEDSSISVTFDNDGIFTVTSA